MRDSTRYLVDGGLWEYTLGGIRWTFEFGKKHSNKFAKDNGTDPLQFLLQGQSTERFLLLMIQASLYKNDKALDMGIVHDDDDLIDMLEKADDEDEDHDEEMMKFSFMYLYALGRPRKQREQTLDFCDTMWTKSRVAKEHNANPFLVRVKPASSVKNISSGPQALPGSTPGTPDVLSPTGS